MPGVSLQGHADDGGGQVVSGTSSTVKVNGKPVALAGAQNTPHDDLHEPSTLLGGSSTVCIEGRAVIRIGDQYACGHSVIEGSGDVRCG